MKPSATFVPHEDGTATAAVPEAAAGATEVMVTREPRPGRTSPTLARDPSSVEWTRRTRRSS